MYHAVVTVNKAYLQKGHNLEVEEASFMLAPLGIGIFISICATLVTIVMPP